MLLIHLHAFDLLATMRLTAIGFAVNAMGLQSSTSPIELADTAQRRIFIVSVTFGVVAALVAALLAWLVWNANNKYQATIKAEADARIAEARDSAARANERAAIADQKAGEANKAAAKANERSNGLDLQTQKLRQQNLRLRGAVVDLTMKAANALAAEQKMQSEQERSALDLAALFDLTLDREPRIFNTWLAQELAHEVATDKSEWKVKVLYISRDAESYTLAKEIFSLLHFENWNVVPPEPMSTAQEAEFGKIPASLLMMESAAPKEAWLSFEKLTNLLMVSAGQVMVTYNNNLSEKTFQIILGTQAP